MKSDNEVLKLKEKLSDLITNLKVLRERRIFIDTSSDKLRDLIIRLGKIAGPLHISTITGIDCKEYLELIYHIWSMSMKVEFSIRVKVDRNNPVVKTITDLIPGATLYEREVYDLLGVKFEGHPELKRLILPEDWPEGIYPLRKDVSLEQVRKIMLKKESS